VQIEWAPDLDGSAGYTVGVWARLDAYPQGTLDHSFACALAKPNSSGRLGNGESYALCVNSSHLVYDYTTSDSESHMLVGQGARAEIAELGRWHHLAATWDATCRTKTLYVDGCRVNASVADVGFDRSPVVVGSDTTSPSSWSGALDDVLIYDRALGDADIKQLVAGTASL
jgi:hypothetical protein